MLVRMYVRIRIYVVAWNVASKTLHYVRMYIAMLLPHYMAKM